MTIIIRRRVGGGFGEKISRAQGSLAWCGVREEVQGFTAFIGLAKGLA